MGYVQTVSLSRWGTNARNNCPVCQLERPRLLMAMRRMPWGGLWAELASQVDAEALRGSTRVSSGVDTGSGLLCLPGDRRKSPYDGRT